jgi:hypothetical protein
MGYLVSPHFCTRVSAYNSRAPHFTLNNSEWQFNVILHCTICKFFVHLESFAVWTLSKATGLSCHIVFRYFIMESSCWWLSAIKKISLFLNTSWSSGRHTLMTHRHLKYLIWNWHIWGQDSQENIWAYNEELM